MENQIIKLVQLIIEMLKKSFSDLKITDEKTTSSSFFLEFMVNKYNFILKSSFHHLDAPWSIKSQMSFLGKELRSLEYGEDLEEPKYELYPLLMKNENDEIVELINELEKDITEYLKEKTESMV